MKQLFFPILMLSILLSSCAAPATPPQVMATDLPSATDAVNGATPAKARTLTVMTHDSFAASEGVIQEFEQANNVKITFIKSGDAGAALNKAILSKAAPLADVF